MHALARVCILESLDLRSGAHKSHRHSSAARGGGWAWRTASCPLAVRTIPYRARRVLLLVRHTRTPHTNTTVHRVPYSSSLTYRDDDRTSGGVRTCRTCDPMLAMYKVTGARYQRDVCGVVHVRRRPTGGARGDARPTPMCAMKSKTRHVPILGVSPFACGIHISCVPLLGAAAVCMLSPGMAFRGISMPRPEGGVCRRCHRE